MPLPYRYSEMLHHRRDQVEAEAAWLFFVDRECTHRVLPDGRFDIILRFQSDGTKPAGDITTITTGATTRFHIVLIAAGTGYVGVRLRPGTAHEVLGTEAETMTHCGLIGDAALAAIPALQTLCLPVRNVDALVGRLTAFVANRLRGVTGDLLSAKLIDMLHVTGGRLPIADITRLYGIDVRTIRRRLVSATGLTPKQIAMVVQFHRALRLRFPREWIAHAVWLYLWFPLSFRLVEEMLLERGIIVSYKTVCSWSLKFRSAFARSLWRKPARRGDVWHLDEVRVVINPRAIPVLPA